MIAVGARWFNCFVSTLLAIFNADREEFTINLRECGCEHGRGRFYDIFFRLSPELIKISQMFVGISEPLVKSTLLLFLFFPSM